MDWHLVISVVGAVLNCLFLIILSLVTVIAKSYQKQFEDHIKDDEAVKLRLQQLEITVAGHSISRTEFQREMDKLDRKMDSMERTFLASKFVDRRGIPFTPIEGEG